MKNTDRIDEVRAYVDENAEDMLNGWIDEPPIRDVHVEEVLTDTDDGCAFGTFVLSGIDKLDRTVTMKIDVSGRYAFEEDKWDWSRETHYTRPYEIEAIEEFEVENRVIEVGGKVVEK